MKNFLKILLQQIIQRLARAIIEKYQPCVIAITGTAGKTSAKEAIAAVLYSDRNIRKAKGSFNTEFGVPITIIGDWNDDELKLISKYQQKGTAFVQKIWLWMRIITYGVWNLLAKVDYPEILILEYGVQRPGDMDMLLHIARPQVAILTSLAEIPVHVDFFRDVEELINEKLKLLRAVPLNGFIIANGDEGWKKQYAHELRGRLVLFGKKNTNSVRWGNLEYLETETRPVGMAVKIQHAGSVASVRFEGIIGSGHAYAITASATVGLILGQNLLKSAEQLQAHYVPPLHRMQIVEGKNGIFIIDDSYNASPIAMEVALEAIEESSAKRKVCVLGDMLELGIHAEKAHKEVGEKAAKVCDVLFGIGPLSAYMVGAAKKSQKNKFVVKHIATREETMQELPSLLKPGDLVLIKASRGIGLDKVVEKLTV